MKPKNTDICPVCDSKTAPASTDADEDDISWIRCDICHQWYHNICLSLSATLLSQLSSYHCHKCEGKFGPSQMKRKSKRARIKIDYVALDQGETFAVDKSVHPHVPNFLAFEPSVALLDNKDKSQIFVDSLQNSELTKEYVFTSKLSKPVIVHDVSCESGLVLPAPRDQITVKYVTAKTGDTAPVEVMDVLSQQSESPAWNLKQWRDYFYTAESARDRIRNVISLEISQVEGLGTKFRRPKMVTDLDLVDKVWRNADGHDHDHNHDQKRPQVTTYCLMSVKGSYTDFHIDFSGTPVYYTVCHGSKTFMMYPPTPDNLALYESWCHEPQQNFTWFAEYTKRIKGKKIRPAHGFKVNLKPADLFIIPSGWIHSVYTPEDAVIIGGNYLTLRDLPMHLEIYEIEKRTKVPSKYRFPMFNKVLWLTSWYYLNHKEEFLKDLGYTESDICSSLNSALSSSVQATSNESRGLEQSGENFKDCLKIDGDDEKGKQTYVADSVKQETEAKYDPNSNSTSTSTSSSQDSASNQQASVPKAILRSLILHLQDHYEASKSQPMAKKSIPTRLIGRNVNNHITRLEEWMKSM